MALVLAEVYEGKWPLSMEKCFLGLWHVSSNEV